MSRMFLNDSRASAIRAFVRTATMMVSVFIIKLDAEQVAAVYAFTESIIQLGRAWTTKSL